MRRVEQIIRRLEAIESEALAELHRAAPAATREAIGLRLEEFDGIRVSAASRGCNIVINRTIGLGLASPATAAQVRRVRSIYEETGVGRYFVHLSPEGRPEPLTELAEQCGLIRDRAWMKFARRDVPVAQRITDLEIREVGPEHADDFGRIAGSAFDLEDIAWPMLGALVGRPGWHVYMSFRGDVPAGAGTLFVDGDVGWTDWGATDPAFRRQGSQSALLARRIARAIDLGCALIGTCTGEAVPGEYQASYLNIQRSGFEEAGLRENYSPTGRPYPI